MSLQMKWTQKLEALLKNITVVNSAVTRSVFARMVVNGLVVFGNCRCVIHFF